MINRNLVTLQLSKVDFKKRSMSQQKRLINSLKEISPTEFENLSFDLLLLCGLKNVTWRTPGPDAGRDIQGQSMAMDFSGHINIEEWYVECKRYKNSIDWPTVFKKLAYAENHEANYLLFITTASLSPRCKEEIQKRELRKVRPRIRFWDGPELETRIMRQPFLLLKYGFENSNEIWGESILPFISHISKSIQAGYGQQVLLGINNSAIEMSAAIVDLMLEKTENITKTINLKSKKTSIKQDLYEWCNCTWISHQDSL
jgi:hypothetical protein